MDGIHDLGGMHRLSRKRVGVVPHDGEHHVDRGKLRSVPRYRISLCRGQVACTVLVERGS